MVKKVLVIGAGKIGNCIAFLLKNMGDYTVTLIDKSQKAIDNISFDIQKMAMDISNETELIKVMDDKDIVISACPFFLNTHITKVADKTNTHYFDLTEDVETTNSIEAIAKNSKVSFMPQCGLAPGFIGISAYHLTKQFDTLDTVKMRVGALPLHPNNRLKYNLTWSSDGLINEYCNPCDALVDGKYIKTNPLEGYEIISIDGVEYEAFNTSGGLGHLHKKLYGRVINLSYKTIRYPGHCDIMKLLLEDLRFIDDRETLKNIMERSIPTTEQDVVVVFVSVTGTKNGQFIQKTYLNKIYSGNILNKLFTAIQITTAAGICAAVDLHAKGKLPQKGFVTQEDVDFIEFIDNKFGKLYETIEV